MNNNPKGKRFPEYLAVIDIIGNYHLNTLFPGGWIEHNCPAFHGKTAAHAKTFKCYE